MNDFETLSRDAAESGEPIEPKRDAETSEEPETVRRVRVGLDALTAELAEAKEAVAYLEARENELLAEKAELAHLLIEARIRNGSLENILAASRLDAKRLKTALDAALNDVATWRRAAFGFGVSSALAVGILLLMIGL